MTVAATVEMLTGVTATLDMLAGATATVDMLTGVTAAVDFADFIFSIAGISGSPIGLLLALTYA